MPAPKIRVWKQCGLQCRRSHTPCPESAALSVSTHHCIASPRVGEGNRGERLQRLFTVRRQVHQVAQPLSEHFAQAPSMLVRDPCCRSALLQRHFRCARIRGDVHSRRLCVGRGFGVGVR
eukprot:3390684-Rhodomonas_salina.3